MQRRDFLNPMNLLEGQVQVGSGQTYYMVTFTSRIDYWKDCFRGMKDAATQVGATALYTGTAQYDVNGEIDTLNTVVRQGPDGILITAIDPDAMPNPIDSAGSQALPLVAFDA